MASNTMQWRARPVATILVKAAILLVPVAVGTLAGFALATAVPPPASTPARVAWSVLILGASTVALMVVERLARRLAPLALLLRLSLVFPDQAPKRFGIALRAIRPSQRVLAPGEPLEARDSLVLLSSLLAHDRRTRGHSERVAAYARMIADEVGLDDQERSRLTWAALLHDIGKLEVPSRILNKPGPLDSGEWRIMAGHPAFGGALVEPLRAWLGDSLSAVDGHHERFDGTGYPYRRRSADLPLAARIVCVADAFEVMTAARSYKEPMSIAAARQEVAACSGGHFDPKVVRAFLDLSVPQLWRVAGPMAWLAQVPVVGLVVRGELVPAALGSAAQSAAMATTQAVTAAAVVGGALVATGGAGVLSHGSVGGAPTTVVSEDEAAGGAGHDLGVGDDAGAQDGPAHGAGDDDGSGGSRGGRGGPGAVDDDPATPGGGSGGGGAADPSTPSRGGSSDTPADTPSDAPADPSTPSGGGGPVGGVVDPVVDDVDDIVGGVVGGEDPVGGIVDPIVDDVDDLIGGVVGGLGLGRH